MSFFSDLGDTLSDDLTVVKSSVSSIAAIAPGLAPVIQTSIQGNTPVAAAASLPASSDFWSSLTKGLTSVTPVFQNLINGVHPTITVRGDVAGTISDAKNAMPWWLIPGAGILLLIMVLKPSGGGSRRRY